MHKKNFSKAFLFCDSCGFLWHGYFSVKHDSDADSEIVLRAVKQPRRVVIDLYRAN